MRLRYIYNPRSGHNRRDHSLLDEIRRRVAACSACADLRITERPRHATELAAEAVKAGCELVVAVGGDGTMNEVAQALVGSPTAMALVPCGSGNGLAMHLRIPTRRHAALALLDDPLARIAAIDTGAVEGRVFCNAMGMGLDAEISRRFNDLDKRGLPGYVRSTYAVLRAARPFPLRILSDSGEQLEAEVLLSTIANSDQYGNRAIIAPGASVDDGLLDLTAVMDVGIPGAAALICRLFAGNIAKSSRVCTLRSTGFTLLRPQSGPLHTDGETIDGGPRVRVEALPSSLRILVPRNSPAGRKIIEASPTWRKKD